jgi:hypothetical protein
MTYREQDGQLQAKDWSQPLPMIANVSLAVTDNENEHTYRLIGERIRWS